MRPQTWLVAIWAGLFLATTVARSQKPAQATGQVTVASESLLHKGIQGLPAIKIDGSAAVATINASLAEYDKKVLTAAKDCDSGLSDDKSNADPKEENWIRTIDVTMSGPRYISYVTKDSYYCGGAHPDAETFALVFDLQTGKLVDWSKLMAVATVQTKTNGDASESHSVSSASVAKIYVAKVLPKLDKDCAEAIRGEDFASGFSLWPDAKTGSLAVHPILSHAVAACGEDVSLNEDEQRSLGVSEEMIAVIRAAHNAQRVSR